MVIKGTMCRVIDNSGAQLVKVIGFFKNPLNHSGKVLSKRSKKHAVVSDLLKVAVRKVEPNNANAIKKGDVFNAVLCQSVRKEHKKSDGSYIKFFSNSVVLVDKQLKPIASRVKETISSKVSVQAIVNISEGTI